MCIAIENHMERSVQFSLVTQSCPTLCDPMDRSMPGLPVHHQLGTKGSNSAYWSQASLIH